MFSLPAPRHHLFSSLSMVEMVYISQPHYGSMKPPGIKYVDFISIIMKPATNALKITSGIFIDAPRIGWAELLSCRFPVIIFLFAPPCKGTSVQQRGWSRKYLHIPGSLCKQYLFFLVTRVDYYFVEKYCNENALETKVQVSKLGQLLICSVHELGSNFLTAQVANVEFLTGTISLPYYHIGFLYLRFLLC